jgi:hypothetical protein
MFLGLVDETSSKFKGTFKAKFVLNILDICMSLFVGRPSFFNGIHSVTEY